MNVMQMRVYISEHPRYKNSKSWRQKCMCMPDRTVVAIYNKFKNVNYKEEEKKIQSESSQKERFHQINMFEYLLDRGGEA